MSDTFMAGIIGAYSRRKHDIHELRVCSGFLWLPRKIDGESRWLCRAGWIEVYDYDLRFLSGAGLYWNPRFWADTAPKFVWAMLGRQRMEAEK